jgi:hypothetical protein
MTLDRRELLTGTVAALAATTTETTNGAPAQAEQPRPCPVKDPPNLPEWWERSFRSFYERDTARAVWHWPNVIIVRI